MGQRKYPPLTPDEIISILTARGFVFHKSSGDRRYSYHTIKGKKTIVQIDMGNPVYSDTWLKLLIDETGMTREQFYCSTKASAKKINLGRAPKEDLEDWVLA